MSNQITSMAQSSQPCAKQNSPGVIKIEYIPINWILTWPEFIDTNNTITSSIQLIPTKDWLLGSFSTGTSKYSEKTKKSKKGLKYKASLKAFISIDSPEISDLFNKMARELFVVKITDKNNSIRILGTPTVPFQFSSELSTGKKTGDSKGHDYTFYGDLFEKAPFYVI